MNSKEALKQLNSNSYISNDLRKHYLNIIFEDVTAVSDFLTWELFKNSDEFERIANAMIEADSHQAYWFFRYGQKYKEFTEQQRQRALSKIIEDPKYGIALFKYEYKNLKPPERTIIIKSCFKSANDAYNVILKYDKKISEFDYYDLMKIIVNSKEYLLSYIKYFRGFEFLTLEMLVINKIIELQDFELVLLLLDKKINLQTDLSKIEDIQSLVIMAKLSGVTFNWN